MSRHSKNCRTEEETREAWIKIRRQTTTSLPDELPDEFFANEYDELKRHPHIEHIRVTTVEDTERVSVQTQQLFVSVEPRTLSYSLTLYLGVYAIIFWKWKGKWRLSIRCIRAGRKDGKKTLTYSHTAGPGGFCFGSDIQHPSREMRNQYVVELLDGGEFFVLIPLILDSLTHINRGEEEMFIGSYRKVVDGVIDPFHPQEGEGYAVLQLP